MKLVLDHNIPRFLLDEFAGTAVVTAESRGWQDLSNGHLMAAAEAEGFDLLVTLDRGFAHQQNMSSRRIAVAILVPGSQQRSAFVEVARDLRDAMNGVRPGSVVIFNRN